MRLRCFAALLSVMLTLAACARQVPHEMPLAQAALDARSELDMRAYGATQVHAEAIHQPRHPIPVRRTAATEHAAYSLDAGDKLRVVVFGQDSLSNNYTVDAGGRVTLPLIGAVPARGLTTAQLSASIAGRLKQSYIRDPSVVVEVETYRPFFVLGEVTYPGQYPYVPDMTVENAIAIAGGFTPRAAKENAVVSRKARGAPVRYAMPLQSRLRPGDTVTIPERWF